MQAADGGSESSKARTTQCMQLLHNGAERAAEPAVEAPLLQGWGGGAMEQ